eukprot:6427713-Amphidinium_carterae.1
MTPRHATLETNPNTKSTTSKPQQTSSKQLSTPIPAVTQRSRAERISCIANAKGFLALIDAQPEHEPAKPALQ